MIAHAMRIRASKEQAVAFHRKVREAYRQIAADESRRVRLIDGGRSREAVAADVWTNVEGLFVSAI